jgi:hypothetical protein
MVKACAKFGARRASVRDTQQKKKQNDQKNPLEKKKNATLFRNDGDTLTQTLDQM